MRSIIIGLSVVFFTFSVFITFKALYLAQAPLADISTVDTTLAHESSADNPLIDAPLANTPSNQDNQKDTVSESNEVNRSLPEDQDAKSAIVSNLEATIAQLEDKLKTTEKAFESFKSTETGNYPRTLTVFGGQTFRSGYDVINEAAAPKIKKLVNEISAFPNSLIIIEGHTDNVPTGKLHSSNMDLSIRRAKAIASTLVSLGIARERISVVGYGDTRPIDTNRTEEGRAKNRRVEVKLMLKQGEN